MKTYTFPVGGSQGKWESWDGTFDFALTDEEAARLEASAHTEPRWQLDEDPDIADICEKVEKAFWEHNKQMTIKDGRLKELRETWLYFNKNAREDEIPSDDELIGEDMGSWHVNYPEELQDLCEDEEE